jgi:probable blue pigment (indigoidine) exporter
MSHLTQPAAASHNSQLGNHLGNVLLTALGPLFWGSTYLVTTQWLPADRPLLLALMRALPVGLLLLLLTRKLPNGVWLWRSFLLGFANFTGFFPLLFLAAYRLPGGVAAMLGALQPLVVIFLAQYLLKTRVQAWALAMGVLGLLGVSLVVLRASAQLDVVGVLAASLAVFLMALATVLVKKWGIPTTPLNFAAWQLTGGGLLLLPLALVFEGSPPVFTTEHWLGLLYLDFFNTALAYMLWFRGISLLPTVVPAFLALLSPVMAVILGWLVLGQAFTMVQLLGMLLILTAIVVAQALERG